jgi:hypothetical protein
LRIDGDAGPGGHVCQQVHGRGTRTFKTHGNERPGAMFDGSFHQGPVDADDRARRRVSGFCRSTDTRTCTHTDTAACELCHAGLNGLPQGIRHALVACFVKPALLDPVLPHRARRQFIHQPVERGHVHITGVQERDHAGSRDAIQQAKS